MTFRWRAYCSTSKRLPWACSLEDKVKIRQAHWELSNNTAWYKVNILKDCYAQHFVRLSQLTTYKMTTLCSLTPMTCLSIQWHCWFWCDSGNPEDYGRQEHTAIVCTLQNPESESNGSLNTEIGSGVWQKGRSRISMHASGTVQRSIIAKLQSKTAQQIQAVSHLICHLLNLY